MNGSVALPVCPELAGANLCIPVASVLVSAVHHKRGTAVRAGAVRPLGGPGSAAVAIVLRWPVAPVAVAENFSAVHSWNPRILGFDGTAKMPPDRCLSLESQSGETRLPSYSDSAVTAPSLKLFAARRSMPPPPNLRWSRRYGEARVTDVHGAHIYYYCITHVVFFVKKKPARSKRLYCSSTHSLAIKKNKNLVRNASGLEDVFSCRFWTVSGTGTKKRQLIEPRLVVMIYSLCVSASVERGLVV